MYCLSKKERNRYIIRIQDRRFDLGRKYDESGIVGEVARRVNEIVLYRSPFHVKICNIMICA